ncbi:MAG: glycosyltransferase family 4 protein [Isosphaeraceae bacterium]|nr:glycosyltransferase family 4 protein [Isosphaeraceae bacterium]
MRLALNFQRVDPTRGGAETYVVDLCQHLIRAGHQVDLYAESWCDGVLPEAVRCVAVPVAGESRLARLKSFARNSEAALQKVTYDCTVGFINTWHHDIIIPQGGVHRGSLEANAKRFPLAWQRGLYRFAKQANPKFWAYQAIERKQYDPERGARVVAVGRMVQDHLIEYHNVARSRIHTIPNAIDPDRLLVPQPGATRCAFRNRMGLAPSDLVGLFVGHNFWLKGLKPLLKALHARKEHGRPVHLLVCGGGKLRPFRRLVNRLGLGDTVHLVGFLPEIRDAFWASDFFVLPTYYDPCSLVVFEALACGLPVITTSCNGAGDLITDGREGYVITAPDAIGELSAAIDHITDDNVRAAMSAHAARLGREQSFERHVARLIRVFEEAAAAKARRGPHVSLSGTRKPRLGTLGR